MERRSFIAGAVQIGAARAPGITLVRTIRLKDGVLTLTTDNLLAAEEGATFNRLAWTRA